MYRGFLLEGNASFDYEQRFVDIYFRNPIWSNCKYVRKKKIAVRMKAIYCIILVNGKSKSA